MPNRRNSGYGNSAEAIVYFRKFPSYISRHTSAPQSRPLNRYPFILNSIHWDPRYAALDFCVFSPLCLDRVGFAIISWVDSIWWKFEIRNPARSLSRRWRICEAFLWNHLYSNYSYWVNTYIWWLPKVGNPPARPFISDVVFIPFVGSRRDLTTSRGRCHPPIKSPFVINSGYGGIG